MLDTAHLIDASPFLFRAYFSLPDSMRSRDGKPVHAVYGFANFLAQYLAAEDPKYVGVFFDGSLTSSFRNKIYPDYKAGRDLPPPEFEAQIEDCREVGKAFGLYCWIDDHYEADDGIGARVAQLREAKIPCVVVSPDKDMAQVVDANTTLCDFSKGVSYGPSEVHKRWGVRPAQIRDMLGLAGDSVDNIPGVRGVGPKTATALLAAFDDLEDLYAHLDDVAALPIRGAKTLGAKLAEARDVAFLSRDLATLAYDAPCEGDLDALAWEGADPDLLDPLFERLNFKGLRKRVPRWK